MAEAVAAFNLAAGVLQFIDFGSRVMSNFWTFYKSNRHGTKEPDLQVINNDLRRVLENLQVPADDTAQSDVGLLQLAQDCQKVALDLETLLQSLFKAEAGNSGKREALKAAFRLVWKDDQVRYLQERLDQFRHQLIVHLLASIRWVLGFFRTE
jgi:hypothetical protein